MKVTYNDAQSSTKLKTLHMLSYYAVRAAPPATPENISPAFGRDVPEEFSVPENAAVGTVVGTVQCNGR